MQIETKTRLTPEEAVEVCYWHLVRGYPQHDLAAMYKVNSGRIAECVGAARKAFGFPTKTNMEA